MTTVLYGALANPPAPLETSQRIKLGLKRAFFSRRDLIGCQPGKPPTFDYRNYGRHESTNVGDQAISQAISLALASHGAVVPLTPVNWGDYAAIRQSLTPPHTNDWLLVAGGGYVFFQRNGELSSRLARDLALCEQRQIKLALVGIGINQQTDSTSNVNVSPEDAETLKLLLQRSSLISVRDAFTQHVLKEYTDKEVMLTGDPALHLASLLSIATPERQTGDSPSIGLNFPFHGPTSTALLSKNFHSYGVALRRLQELTSCQYFYLQHYDTEAVLPSFLRRLGVKVTHVPNDIPTMLETYAGLDLHIGGMLHSCIFAHSVDTPCVGLAYDVKHMGFFELFGMSDHCISAFDFNPDTLLEKACEILTKKSDVRTRIRRTREALHAMSANFFSDLSGQISASPASSDI